MDEHEINLEINWNGNLTLIRHGETDYNKENRFIGVSDQPLNKKGREQAKVTGEYLMNWSMKNKIDFDVILSSPLQRCYETAKIINKYFEIDVHKEDLLRERNYGVFEGLQHKVAAEKYPDLWSRYKMDKPFVTLLEGESGYDVEERIQNLLTDKIPKDYQDYNEILLVSHLNPLRAFFRLMGLADWDIYFKPFNNASVSRIKINSNEIKFEFCDRCPLVK